MWTRVAVIDPFRLRSCSGDSSDRDIDQSRRSGQNRRKGNYHPVLTGDMKGTLFPKMFRFDRDCTILCVDEAAGVFTA